MSDYQKEKNKNKALKEMNEMLIKENFSLRKEIKKMKKNNKELCILLQAKIERLKNDKRGNAKGIKR